MSRKLQAALYELERQRKLSRAEDDEVERLTALAEHTGGSGYGEELARGSGTTDRMAQAAIRLSEHKTAVKRDRRNRTPFKAAALAVIWSELDDGAALVAEAYYNRGLDNKQIAKETGYSIRWVYMQQEKIDRAKRV